MKTDKQIFFLSFGSNCAYIFSRILLKQSYNAEKRGKQALN